jgi:hypothetical protein
MLGDGAEEAGDVVRVGFGGGGPVEFEEGLGGDGADGDCWNAWEWKWKAGLRSSFGKMGDAGGAGEGGGGDSGG